MPASSKSSDTTNLGELVRTYVVDVLWRLARLRLRRRRGPPVRQQRCARAALHVVGREERLHMRESGHASGLSGRARSCMLQGCWQCDA